MRIIKLVLKYYKHLELSGISTFEMDCVNDLSLIIGSNGSGKSSLLAMLTPNVPQKIDFRKGGYKEIHITHNSKTYVLISIMDSGKHKFMDGEENLNPGGTATVQRNLVETIFNYTPMLHELLTGSTSFTDMSPSARRQWIERLCDVDVTYASKIYESIKKHAQALHGAIKISKERLVRDSGRLEQKDEHSYIEEQIESLKTILSELMKEVNNNLPVTSTIKREIEEGYIKLTAIGNNAVQLKSKVKPAGDFNNIEEVEGHLTYLSNTALTTQATLTANLNELDELSKTIDQLTGDNNVEALEVLLENKITESVQLGEVLTKLTSNEISEVSSALGNGFSMSLHELISNLPDNYTTNITLEEHSSNITKAKELDGRLLKGETYILNVTNRIEMITESKESTCPKCKYVYRPGISDDELVKATKCLEDAAVLVDQLSKDRAVVADSLMEYENWKTAVSMYRTHVQYYARLYQFIDRLSVEDALANPTDIGITAFRQGEVLKQEQYKLTLHSDITRITDDIERIKLVTAGYGIEVCTKKRDALQFTVERMYVDLKMLAEQTKQFDTFRTYVIKLSNLNIESTVTLESLFELHEIYATCVENDLINKTIRDKQILLANLQQEIDSRETLRKILTDLKVNIATNEESLTSYKLIMTALSPNNGLIAEQLTGFIKRLTGQMNIIISRIWEYEMQVMSCKAENGSLDYKFPLLVRNEESISPDIKKGSKGQRDCINFVFTLIVSAYLGLRDYPLYMDELGASFDEAHRESLMREIHVILTTSQCSQLFMVNHYASNQIVSSNTDIIVLDEANIAVPEEFNKYVKIT